MCANSARPLRNIHNREVLLFRLIPVAKVNNLCAWLRTVIMANVIHIAESFLFDTGDVLDNTLKGSCSHTCVAGSRFGQQPHVALNMLYCSVC